MTSQLTQTEHIKVHPTANLLNVNTNSNTLINTSNNTNNNTSNNTNHANPVNIITNTYINEHTLNKNDQNKYHKSLNGSGIVINNHLNPTSSGNYLKKNSDNDRRGNHSGSVNYGQLGHHRQQQVYIIDSSTPLIYPNPQNFNTVTVSGSGLAASNIQLSTPQVQNVHLQTQYYQAQANLSQQALQPHTLQAHHHESIIPGSRRIQYIPYQQKYIQYVQQTIKVPVQKTYTDYYQIEHITQYIPKEVQQIVYETQAKEIVEMRLEYIPVQQKIVHISDKNARSLNLTSSNNINGHNNANQTYGHGLVSSSLYQPLLIETSQLQGLHSHHNHQQVQKTLFVQNNNVQHGGNHNSSYINVVNLNGYASKANVNSVNNGVGQTMKRSRTNFITSQGYDPEVSLKEIDRILNESAIQVSRVRI